MARSKQNADGQPTAADIKRLASALQAITPEEAARELERRQAERSRKGRPLVLEKREDAPHRFLGGSQYEPFNTTVVHQAQNSAWYGTELPDEDRERLVLAAAGAMADIKPMDPVEGMLAAQMVATHNAVMECYRRAMIPNQHFDGRNSALAHANKLTRSFATLSQALDKHRGQGKQTVRVEHVHVYKGGQAVVGNVHAKARQEAENALPPEFYTPGDENGDN